jgi:hypothetical protein
MAVAAPPMPPPATRTTTGITTVLFYGRMYYLGTDFVCVKFVRHPDGFIPSTVYNY